MTREFHQTIDPVSYPIVVGVDGSTSSLHATRWALTQAQRQRRTLHLVHAYVWPLLRVPPGPYTIGWAIPNEQDQAQALLDSIAAAARTAASDVTVTTELATGSPADVLIDASSHAHMLVVGSRGMGGFSGLLLGSTSRHVSTHSACPTIVIHPQGEQNREEFPDLPDPLTLPDAVAGSTITVGAEGPESEPAIGFAFDMAAAAGLPLTVVHTWSDLSVAAPSQLQRPLLDWEEMYNSELRIVSELLAGWRENYPQVEVTVSLFLDNPVHALVTESRDSEILVVGTHGRGRLSGIFTGSISQNVIGHATCPVAIVPIPQDRDTQVG